MWNIPPEIEAAHDRYCAEVAADQARTGIPRERGALARRWAGSVPDQPGTEYVEWGCYCPPTVLRGTEVSGPMWVTYGTTMMPTAEFFSRD